MLERVGGKAFVHTLVEIVPAAANVRQYAEIVRETSVLRQLIRVGNEIAELGYEHPGDARTLLDSCEQKVFAISQHRLTSDFDAMRRHGQGDLRAHRHDPRGPAALGRAHGLRRHRQACTGGFQPSNLIVLAARPGVGKTSLALNIAHNIGHHRHGVGRHLQPRDEQAGDQRAHAVLGRAGQPRTGCARARRCPTTTTTSSCTVAGELEKAPIYVDDTAGINVFELRAKARRLASRVDPPLGLVIIDYLQLMMGDGRADNRQQEVANISRSLKQLARELNVPVLAVSQLNRDVETRAEKKPQLSDLRESGAIEQDADLVIFIYEPRDENSKGVVAVDIAKHRNGPTGHRPPGLRARLHQVPHAQGRRGQPL